MLALDPRAVLRCGLYLAVGLFVALGIRSCPTEARPDPAHDLLSADLARRLHANTLALAEAHQALAAAAARSSRTIVSYKTLRDTLRITDTVAVKVFVARADSVVRSCTALAESCERFRVRADSSLASLTLDRDRWKLAAEASRPSGFSLFVRRTLPVVAFVGGVVVGARAVR